MKNRIREALSIRNMKQIELSERSGIDKAAINHYINHRYQPKQQGLLKMAKILDVNEMWLAGYDVPMERNVVDKNNSEAPISEMTFFTMSAIAAEVSSIFTASFLCRIYIKIFLQIINMGTDSYHIDGVK